MIRRQSQYLGTRQSKYKFVSTEHIIPMVAVMMMYEMVVQKIAISVPLGMATVGFWEGEDKRNDQMAFKNTFE